jgi:PAS domain S-box-containing protein
MPPVRTRKTTPKLTELRARVAELERERELLNAIANWAPSLLCLVGADGRVRPYASNKAFERTMGYEPEETGGVLFWERYVPAEDALEVKAAIEDVIAGGTMEERDGRWLTRSGEIIHVLWSCTPLPMIESGPVFLILAADISEQKRSEEQVRSSRARIVAAADEARRRLEAAALKVVADRPPVPVELSVPKSRYSEPVEAAAYYVVSETLANVAKYADASRASVRVRRNGGRLVVDVEDDGVGVADAARGTGLRGLEDRVAALDGTFSVVSPAGGGTRVRATIPIV